MKKGNNILYNGSPCKIIAIKDGVYYLQDNNTKQIYLTTKTFLKGIYITKYILVSKGFKKSLRTWLKDEITIYNKPIHLMQVYYYNGKRIKYVHELENIINN